MALPPALEIARWATLRPIEEIAAGMGIQGGFNLLKPLAIVGRHGVTPVSNDVGLY